VARATGVAAPTSFWSSWRSARKWADQAMELVLPDPADHLAIFGLLVIAQKEIRDRPDERGQGLMVLRKLSKSRLMLSF
jgi:hypothetical protein